VRIAPSSWSEPEPDDWDRAISVAVDACARPPLLVAHSLGVLAVARWLAEHAAGHGAGRVIGAFLVAPPDPDAPVFPAEAARFHAPRGGPAARERGQRRRRLARGTAHARRLRGVAPEAVTRRSPPARNVTSEGSGCATHRGSPRSRPV